VSGLTAWQTFANSNSIGFDIVIQAPQEDLPMSDQFWLTKAQLKRIEAFFPRTPGIPRVDDRRVVSGIVHVIRNGLRWRDAPAVYCPHKTLYNRFVRWSRMGIFDRIFANLAAENGPRDRVMIDGTHLKAHRRPPVCSKGGFTPSHRPHERPAELQAARGLRRRWPASYLSSHRRANE
jgi:putative transposase